MDEDFNDLHLDTKMVYTYLLTSPGHGLSGIININRKIMAAQIGLSVQSIELGLQQLSNDGWILLHTKYAKLTKDHVEAKKGRYTEQAIEKELKDIPQEVLDFFDGFSPILDESIEPTNEVALTKPAEVIVRHTSDDERLTELLYDLMHENAPHRPRGKPTVKDYETINKMHRIDTIPYEYIEGVIRWSQADDFWKANIRSTNKLRQKYDQLELQARRAIAKMPRVVDI